MEKMKVNDKEYSVIKLLGHGKGGYSYLVTDGKNQYVIKQIHHEPCDYYQFGNKLESEINDYNRLVTTGIHMPVLYDVDEKNERILKEFIDGDIISDLIISGKMKNEYLLQIQEMAKKVYQHNLNIDYFPTNFVVANGIIYYIDFECNDYMEEWNFENWGIKYWSKTNEFKNHFNC